MPNDRVGLPAELVASRHPSTGEMDAYERVLGEAIHGDVTLFAREDYVEEAWRIVDPVLAANTPVYEYDAGTWGSPEVSSLLPRGRLAEPNCGGCGSGADQSLMKAEMSSAAVKAQPRPG